MYGKVVLNLFLTCTHLPRLSIHGLGSWPRTDQIHPAQKGLRRRLFLEDHRVYSGWMVLELICAGNGRNAYVRSSICKLSSDDRPWACTVVVEAKVYSSPKISILPSLNYCCASHILLRTLRDILWSIILILIAQGRIECDTLGGTHRTLNIITRFLLLLLRLDRRLPQVNFPIR